MKSKKRLLRFLFEEMPCYGGESPILEVTDISLATTSKLSRLYLSKREGEEAMCRPIVSLMGDIREDATKVDNEG